jgi:Cu(I)/Ag(I) efflux system membrane fusion protein
VIEGDRVPAGTTVLEIAALDPVWIDLEVFEGDLSLLREGMEVSLDLSNVPGRSFSAEIDYVYPTLDRERRAARVRLVVPNPDLALRPGMHARANLEVDLGERLLVPREAVVYTGPRRIVFVDVGEGRLLPREVVTGQGAPTHLEVLSGLEEGERVVSSGTFLIASESRIRSAETVWGTPDDDR